MTISIDRQAKSWAVYDDMFDCVKPFEPYADEAAALATARAWILERGGVEPKVVYPSITRMTMSTGRRRR